MLGQFPVCLTTLTRLLENLTVDMCVPSLPFLLGGAGRDYLLICYLLLLPPHVSLEGQELTCFVHIPAFQSLALVFIIDVQ